MYDEGRLRDRVARALEVKNVLFEHLYHKPLMSLEEIVPDLMAAGRADCVLCLRYVVVASQCVEGE